LLYHDQPELLFACTQAERNAMKSEHDCNSGLQSVPGLSYPALSAHPWQVLDSVCTLNKRIDPPAFLQLDLTAAHEAVDSIMYLLSWAQ